MSIYTDEITPGVLRRLQDRAAQLMRMSGPEDLIVCDVWRIPMDCRSCEPQEVIRRCVQVPELVGLAGARLREIRVEDIKDDGALCWRMGFGKALSFGVFYEFIKLFDYPPRFFHDRRYEENDPKRGSDVLR